MSNPAPVLERALSAPGSIRDEISSLVPHWFGDAKNGGAASYRASDEARAWLFSTAPFLFDGALWIAEGATLRRLPLVSGATTENEEEWPLPRGDDLTAEAGITRTTARPLPLPALQPAFGLPDGRMLWLALEPLEGYPFVVAALVLFDPHERAWQTLVPASGSEPIHPSLLVGLEIGERLTLHAEGDAPGGLGTVCLGRELDLDTLTIHAPLAIPRARSRAVSEGPRRLLRAFVCYGPPALHFPVDGTRVLVQRRDARPWFPGLEDHAPLSPNLADLAVPLGARYPTPRFDLAREAITGDHDDDHVILSELLSTPGTRRVSVWSLR